jgi:hypothetical protein
MTLCIHQTPGPKEISTHRLLDEATVTMANDLGVATLRDFLGVCPVARCVMENDATFREPKRSFGAGRRRVGAGQGRGVEDEAAP